MVPKRGFMVCFSLLTTLSMVFVLKGYRFSLSQSTISISSNFKAIWTSKTHIKSWLNKMMVNTKTMDISKAKKTEHINNTKLMSATGSRDMGNTKMFNITKKDLANSDFVGEVYQLIEYFARPMDSHRSLVLANLSLLKNFSRQYGKSFQKFWSASTVQMFYKFKPIAVNVFSLTEFDNRTGRYSNGGTTFRLKIFAGVQRDICNYQDHFNGTYSIRCPYRCSSTHIEVIKHGMNFQSYFSHRGILEKYKIQKILSYNLSPSCKSTFVPSECPVCTSITRNTYGGWLQLPGNNSTGNHSFSLYNNKSLIAYHYNYHCIQPQVRSSALRKCIQSFDKIYFIGDSTMRFIFYYMLLKANMLPKLPMRYKGEIAVSNIIYNWTTIIETLQSNIQLLPHYQRSVPRDKPVLLVFNTMHHDVSRLRISNLLSQWEEVLRDIVAIRERNPQTRLLWLNTEPLRELPTDGTTVQNNFVISAVNQIFEKIAHKYKVDTFDRFTMGVTLEADCPDHIHLLQVNPETQQAYGSVGTVIGDHQILYICKDFLY